MDAKKVMEMLMSNLESEVSISQSPVMRYGTTLLWNLPLLGATPYMRRYGSTSMVISFVPLWESSTISFMAVWTAPADIRYVSDPLEELGRKWKELEDMQMEEIREIAQGNGRKWK